MVKICQAVHHAHQRGLIHRDLKPGNILVDETGQPKILDFGVARVTDSEAQVTRQTDVGQLVGTLEYMSPEQVLADPEAIDTRSDVYALGVILYEMLAGRRPYKLKRQLHEAVQAIREEDPPPLSSVSREYRGDIETIVAKALEKDKERRYGSAAALAWDLEHYLTDQPIAARQPSAIYHLRKFARRHKALVGGVAAVFVALAVGIVASTWEAIRANRAQQAAQLEAATAKAVNDFLENDLLAQASAAAQSSPTIKPDPNLTVRTALDRAASRIAGKFDSQPLVEASIRHTIAGAYKDLGLTTQAQQQLERVLELRRKVLGDENPDTLSTINDLAVLYLRQGRFAESESLQAKVVEARRRLLGEENPVTLYDEGNLAYLYMNQGRFEQAEQLLIKILPAQRRVIGEQHVDTLFTMSNLALLYRAEGKYAQAEPLAVEVLQSRRRVLGEEHPDTLSSLSILAQVYQGEGRYSEAEPLFGKVLEVRRRVLGEEHFSTLVSMNYLADLYRVEGKDAQAEAFYSEVLERRRRTLGPDHPDTIRVMASLGQMRLQQHDYKKAETFLRQALNTQEKKNPDSWQRFDSQSLLGAALVGQRKYAEAEPLLLSGYDGLIQRKASIPQGSRSAVKQAGDRIVQLYERWRKPESEAQWRTKTRRLATLQ
jgi:eukaryotic-like serine/threonine-protein kinase